MLNQFSIPHAKVNDVPIVNFELLGVKITNLTIDTLHQAMAISIQQQKKRLILNVNIHCINLAYEQPWLRTFLNSAEIVFCDGYGVKLGAWLMGQLVSERITYADWMWQLGAFCANYHYSLFFLGSRPGVAEKAAQRLQHQYPTLQITGVQHGYFDKTSGSSENTAVIAQINQAKPHILVVGFGMPMQEQWLMENWHHLDANIALTGGAVFDYISGELQRGPKWLTNSGFEWLARLIIEPRRLWKRYVLGNPLFFYRLFKQKVKLLITDKRATY